MIFFLNVLAMFVHYYLCFVFIDWNCVSGERCSPWTSCLFLLLDDICLFVWPLFMEQAI